MIWLLVIFLSPLVILPLCAGVERREHDRAINQARAASTTRANEAWFEEEARLAAISARADAARTALSRIARRVVGYGLLAMTVWVLLCALLHSLTLI